MEPEAYKQLIAQQIGNIIVDKVLQLDFMPGELVEFLSYRALEKIIRILESDLDDAEAVQQIMAAIKERGIIVVRHGFGPKHGSPKSS